MDTQERIILKLLTLWRFRGVAVKQRGDLVVQDRIVAAGLSVDGLDWAGELLKWEGYSRGDWPLLWYLAVARHETDDSRIKGLRRQVGLSAANYKIWWEVQGNLLTSFGAFHRIWI